MLRLSKMLLILVLLSLATNVDADESWEQLFTPEPKQDLGGLKGFFTPTPNQDLGGLKGFFEQSGTSKYRVHSKVLATQFYVQGAVAWDVDALKRFGCIDSPYGRVSDNPPDCTPRRNPFYLALPYSDIGPDGEDSNKSKIPWYNKTKHSGKNRTALKGRWVEVTHGSRKVYAQLIDCLPVSGSESSWNKQCNHFNYVFGDGKPTYPGIDISPSTSRYLGLYKGGYHSDDHVSWTFVDDEDVPYGPWKKYPAWDNNVYWTPSPYFSHAPKGKIELTPNNLSILLAGKYPVVVTFGATSCPPCRALRKSLSTLQKEGWNFAFVTVTGDRDPLTGEKIANWLYPTFDKAVRDIVGDKRKGDGIPRTYFIKTSRSHRQIGGIDTGDLRGIFRAMKFRKNP